jgi:hypothetical protein
MLKSIQGASRVFNHKASIKSSCVAVGVFVVMLALCGPNVKAESALHADEDNRLPVTKENCERIRDISVSLGRELAKEIGIRSLSRWSDSFRVSRAWFEAAGESCLVTIRTPLPGRVKECRVIRINTDGVAVFADVVFACRWVAD